MRENDDMYRKGTATKVAGDENEDEDYYYEEDEEENQSWKYNDSDGGEEDEEEDEEYERDQIKQQKQQQQTKANENANNKFTINLNNLKADLKRKSAKLLSKLNVSNKEMKNFFVGSTATEKLTNVNENVDGAEDADDMNDDLIKFFNETQVMYLNQKKINITNLTNSLETQSNDITSTDLSNDHEILNDECSQFGNWLLNVDIKFNKVEAVSTDDSIEKLIEKLNLLKKSLKVDENMTERIEDFFNWNENSFKP